MYRLGGWPHAAHMRGMLLAPNQEGGAGAGGLSGLIQVSSCPLQSPLFLLSFQNTNSPLLNNYVLGAQLGHGHVNNLREPVNISFWHNQSMVPLGVPPFPSHLCPFVDLLLKLNPNLWNHLGGKLF